VSAGAGPPDASAAAPDPSAWTLPRLAITRDGAWLHEGVEVTHPGIVASLWSGLRVDAGGHHLAVGRHRIPVEVEDAPFVVVRLEREGGRLIVTLVDGTREGLDPRALELRGDVPYARVREGRFTARFSRAAAWQLWQLVEYDEARDTATLTLAGQAHPIPVA
jgi:hypothetical protein